MVTVFRRLLVAALLLPLLRATARVPAGTGGMMWRSALPVSNTLRGVAAAPPGAEGAGLVVVGDASTLLLRKAAFGTADGWATARQRGAAQDVSFRGVAVNRDLGLMVVAANDGTVLLGNGRVMPARAWAPRALNAVGIAQGVGALARVTAVGDGGAAFYADFAGSFTDIQVKAVDVDSAAGTPDLYALRFAPTGPQVSGVGYAAGESAGRGVILKTFDGGAHWQLTPRVPEAESFFDVFVEDANTLFVLGERAGNGVIYRSLDGGLNWDNLPAVLPPGSRSLASLGQQRMAVGGRGGLYVSRDGGQTFEPAVTGLPPGRTIPFEGIDSVPGSGEAFAVGAGGVILWTRNSGDSWAPFTERPLTGADLSDFRAARYLSYPEGPYVPSPNGALIIVSTASGELLESRDGGATFARVASPTGSALRTIATPLARNAGTGGMNPAPGAFLGGDRRTVVVFDAGQDKAFLKAEVPKVDYLGVAIAPDGRAWAVGRKGTIIYSDGGPLWRPLASGVTADLYAVSVSQTGAVYAVGSNGTVLKSPDGTAWTAATKPSDVNLLAADFTYPDRGYVVGAGGTVATTANGGASWSVQTPTGGAPALFAVHVVPGTNGMMAWAVGANQTVMRTTNGGQTWETGLPKPDPTSDFALRAVQFLTPDIGYVAGDDGRVFRTTTGGLPGAGEPWTELGMTLGDRINGLRFADPMTGVLVGGNLFTGATVTGVVGGGDSLTAPILPPSAGTSLNAVDVRGSAAVAVGDGGVILQTAGFLEGPYFDAASAVSAIVSPAPGVYVAAGDDSLLMYSEDAGLTWRRASVAGPVSTGLRLTSAGFANQGVPSPVGYAGGFVEGGHRPILYRTTDLGRTWTPVTLDFGNAIGGINALGVVNASNVVAAAGNGWVYQYNGSTWTAVRPVEGFGGRWNGLLALDARMYVAGENGAAARYPSRGSQPSWETLNTGTVNALNGIVGPPKPGGNLAPEAGGDSLHDDICNAFGSIGAWLESTTGCESMFGDTNSDAMVTLVDAVTVLKVAAGLMEPSAVVYFMGDVVTPAPTPEDVPGDGYLTILDAAQILRTAMGL
jgi:photosystem II stability/assembly factor-like uncharacterized protein